MDDIFYIEFSEIEEDEDTQWIWDFRKQALFSSDKKTRQLRYLMSLPRGEENRYHRIIKYKTMLVAIPVTADDILIYNIVTNTSTKLPLPTGIWNEDAKEKGKFGRGIIYDKYLILLPSWSNAICKIDMEQVSIVDIKDISYTGIKTNGAIPFGKAILENEHIYMAAAEEPVLITINANTLECTKKIFSHYEKGFCTIIRLGECYWLFPRYRGDIIKWDKKKDLEERYSISRELLSPIDKAGFNSVKRVGDNLWLFPITAPEVLRIDIKSGKVEKEDVFKEYSTYKEDSDTFVKYWMTKVEGSVLKAYSTIKGLTVQYDTEKGILEEVSYFLSEEDRKRYFIDVEYTADQILVENILADLTGYLKLIVEKNIVLSREQMDGTVGKKIYQTIRDYY